MGWGAGNLGGGSGGGLNFKVVGNPQPTSPKENTIWVNTDVPITSYVFSATQPTGSAGMVWITTGTYRPVAFNALKKNGIQVYPISAKQYIGGAWVEKTAQIYQGGAWYDFYYYIFKSGEGQKVALTTYKENSSVNVTIGTDTIILSYSGEAFCSGIQTKSKIDLTDYSTIKIAYTCSMVPSGGAAAWASAFGVSSSAMTGDGTTADEFDIASKKFSKSTSLRTDSLDISQLSGSYYLGVFGSSKVTIHNFWLE